MKKDQWYIWFIAIIVIIVITIPGIRVSILDSLSAIYASVLVIDEAWWLMQHEDSARFIFALVKRCRKYYLGVTTITQDVNDFLKSQYGQAIVTNSALQLLMRQSPAAIDLIQKIFLLTDSEKYLLLQSGIGEGIFFAGSKHAAIRVV
jgi:type IV secretory pathway VirB4 component